VAVSARGMEMQTAKGTVWWWGIVTARPTLREMLAGFQQRDLVRARPPPLAGS
jgi:hypothetical protein